MKHKPQPGMVKTYAALVRLGVWAIFPGVVAVIITLIIALLIANPAESQAPLVSMADCHYTTLAGMELYLAEIQPDMGPVDEILFSTETVLEGEAIPIGVNNAGERVWLIPEDTRVTHMIIADGWYRLSHNYNYFWLAQAPSAPHEGYIFAGPAQEDCTDGDCGQHCCAAFIISGDEYAAIAATLGAG